MLCKYPLFLIKQILLKFYANIFGFFPKCDVFIIFLQRLVVIGGGGGVKWETRKAWSILINDEQPMINDEMRMRKILTDQFRSRKDSSPFIFKGGRGKERGWPVELLMHKNNRRRKSSWSKRKRNIFLTKEQRNKCENEYCARKIAHASSPLFSKRDMNTK